MRIGHSSRGTWWISMGPLGWVVFGTIWLAWAIIVFTVFLVWALLITLPVKVIRVIVRRYRSGNSY